MTVMTNDHQIQEMKRIESRLKAVVDDLKHEA